MLLIGVDTGGTFTDFIWKDGDNWGEYKCLSTPHNPAGAVLQGIRHIAAERDYQLVHGSTVATNAILEKRGAKTALITNRRFEDVIEIARQNRGHLYDFFYRKNAPLVPRELRFGISGRVDQNGEVIEPLDPADLARLKQPLQESGVESLAVSLLFSFKNPEHERQVRDALACLGIPLSLSYETLAEFREYERTSTTVINALCLAEDARLPRFFEPPDRPPPIPHHAVERRQHLGRDSDARTGTHHPLRPGRRRRRCL